MVEKYARENGLTLAQANEQINGDQSFQRELQNVSERLRREEPTNFVELQIVRDPAVAAEVAFLRNPKETLAHYTHDPRFRAVQVRQSRAEMDSLQVLWTERLKAFDGSWGIGVNAFAGRLDIDLGVSEAEFRAVAEAKRWTWGGEVHFAFAPPALTAQINPAVRFPFHLFPRSRTGATIVLTVAIGGTVVLDRGCFRLLGREGKVGNLVLFDRSAQIGQDSEGYLAVFGEGKVASRIGEPVIWGGYPGANERDPDVVTLRQKCGNEAISSVGVPRSSRLFALPEPEWVANYAAAKRLTFDEAWTRVIDCMKRYEEQHGPAAPFLEARNGCITQFN